jgi:hypothetical protein
MKNRAFFIQGADHFILMGLEEKFGRIIFSFLDPFLCGKTLE